MKKPQGTFLTKKEKDDLFKLIATGVAISALVSLFVAISEGATLEQTLEFFAFAAFGWSFFGALIFAFLRVVQSYTAPKNQGLHPPSNPPNREKLLFGCLGAVIVFFGTVIFLVSLFAGS